MSYVAPSSTRRKVMAVVLGLLTLASIHAQAPQTDTQPKTSSRPVPLVSDSCPQVREGDRITLDWNPGFDHAGIVTGLKSFSLVMAGVNENGAIGRQRIVLAAGGRGHSPFASSLGNGYYHIEIPVPSDLPEGVYRLVDADTDAEAMAGYENEPRPQMTVSPVRERFCITVLPRIRFQGSTP